MKNKKQTHLGRKLLLLATAAILPLSFAQAANAQDAFPYSFGDMLAPGGVLLPGGVTATATIINTGTAVEGPNLGNTNLSPAPIGGTFSDSDTGFDEANFTIGDAIDTTRIHSSNGSSLDFGASNQYKSGTGMKVTFDSPMPVSYFYAMDLDVREWKSSFGIDASGNYVEPIHSLSSATTLTSTSRTVDSSTWETSLGIPTGTIPGNVQIVNSNLTSALGPEAHRGQVLFNFNDQSLTEVYFLYGRQLGPLSNTAGSNSGLSALFLRVPEFTVSKSAAAQTLQPDGSFNVSYSLLVENTGGYDVSNLSLVDDLEANLGVAFDSIVGTPSITGVTTTAATTLPTLNGAYDGTTANAQLIGSSGTLAVGESFQVDFTVKVLANGAPPTLGNTATVSGIPAGFTNVITDASDPMGGGAGGGEGSATTITLPVLDPALTLTKLADDDEGRAVGETVTYTYMVTNTGNVNISDVNVSDVHSGDGALSAISITTLTNTSGNSVDDSADNDIDLLAPGDGVTFEASYVITAADISAGIDITNIATATGTPAAGTLTDPTAAESVSLFIPPVSLPAFSTGPGLGASVCAAVPATSPYQNYGIRWDHAIGSGTSPNATVVATDTFASATAANYVGIDAQVNSYDVNIDADTIPEAFDPNVYMEYQFTTEDFDNLAEIRGIANTLYGIDDPAHYIATGSYRYAVAIDDDASFGSPEVLISDVTVDGVDTSNATVASGVTDNGKYLRAFAHWDVDGTTVNLLPETTYTVRVYPYSVYERGEDSVQAYSNLVLWDDFMLKSLSCDYTIEAQAESFSDITTDGGVTTSVLASDELNGASVDPADITLTVGDILDASGSPSTGLSLDPATGLITVAPNTLPGTYTVEYTICEDATPNNCATATETIVVNPIADLSITKTNTPGVNGEVDQAADTLTSGDTTTYTLLVTNNGPDGVTGAVVNDVVGSGLTCLGTDPVALSGDGVPTGSFTIADLTGAGITLARLEDTESTELSYSCTVN